jgi:uncharacterized protein DUF4112
MTTTYDFDFARPRSRRARIARIDALATLLDTALVIPGTGIRFGLDALIGFFPVLGDTITTALSLFIVHEAYQLGAPGPVIARMLGNVALDGVLSAVPLVGDVFVRANRRNVRLLLEWLEYEHRRDEGARCVTNFGGLVPLGLHRNPGRSLLFGESAIFQMCSFKAKMLEWSGA